MKNSNDDSNWKQIRIVKVHKLISEGLEKFVSEANTIVINTTLTTILIIFTIYLGILRHPYFFIISIISSFYLIYLLTKPQVSINYSSNIRIPNQLAYIIHIKESIKIWSIIESENVYNKKYEAGAGSTIRRTRCEALTKIPFPFKTNTSDIIVFKTNKGKIVFLPDRIIFKRGLRIGALYYKDIHIWQDTCQFIETEEVPCDSPIVNYTWKYVNKNGDPDLRFKNNKRFAVCKYGELIIQGDGINIVIMYSDPDVFY